MKVVLERKSDHPTTVCRQFATFYLDGRLYGIDVYKVQEVTRPLKYTVMRTAPSFIKGLINLRGQIATAISLKDLFGLPQGDEKDKMTVVCRVDDFLLSFFVDSIGDVIEVRESDFESAPLTIPSQLRLFMEGVYKTESNILSVLSLNEIVKQLEKKSA